MSLADVNLDRADLREAKLQGVQLIESSLCSANLSGPLI